MQELKSAIDSLVRAARGNRRFDDEQRLALSFFVIALSKATAPVDVRAEFDLLQPLLGRIAVLNTEDQEACRSVRLAWRRAMQPAGV